MRMYDLIAKKRDGGALTKEEIQYMITEYVEGRIPDYQMSAFLMVVYHNGMTEEETVTMTQCVAHSGYGGSFCHRGHQSGQAFYRWCG